MYEILSTMGAKPPTVARHGMQTPLQPPPFLASGASCPACMHKGNPKQVTDFASLLFDRVESGGRGGLRASSRMQRMVQNWCRNWKNYTVALITLAAILW